ncbi:saccharopine dehydrogenase NADP-binding domain-containing protein [Ideonella sp. A 288]|uniref:saccharopine dehydrogenase NADP-binding domain-containing protein n=1 Tax=Ideonella sp. A 288 TaxID=1962181 RepID=UPI000B4C148A|nr:saccharopine dehydrogenase NADP-binding domain-containing protein [Ideonella sp. A 288]
MRPVLIYGAYGRTGRLIVEQAARLPGWRLILAGRDPGRLAELARPLGLETRAFTLDRPEAVRDGLREVGVVVNAAGPYAATAERLAKSAIRVGAHYADLCGEEAAWRQVKALDRLAAESRVALVCGAAVTPGLSALLLASLVARQVLPRFLGEVRIVLSRPDGLGSGSLRTLWESSLDRVLVVRQGVERTVPVGRHEHLIDFGATRPGPRIAMAAGLVDTLAVADTLAAAAIRADGICSFVEAGSGSRWLADAAAWAAPLRTLPTSRPMAALAASLLDATPVEPLVVALQVEDPWRAPLVDQRFTVPEPYSASAAIAVAAARLLAQAQPESVYGWKGIGTLLRGQSELATSMDSLEPISR